MERQFIEQAREFEAAKVPGTVAVYIYRMDADPNEYYLAVVFESREAYLANADSPEQDARYRQVLSLLEREPEWHDGEIVYALQA
jgi:quinol monooxygenase YgiN